jgi:hypothetical protein
VDINEIPKWLNYLVTSLKYVKRWIDPTISKLLPLEHQLILSCACKCEESIKLKLINQMARINFVGRVIEKDIEGDFSSIYLSIIKDGLTVYDTSFEVLDDKSEHMLSSVKFKIDTRQFSAKLWAANGRIVSLEFNGVLRKEDFLSSNLEIG